MALPGFLTSVVLALAVTSADAGDAGFTSLFNGKDLSGWRVPDGDNGHWKVVDGVIDYDALSEAKGDKNLWSEREYRDFVLKLDWRLKEAPFINRSVPYILPDGTHARDIHGKELKLALPDADSGVFLRGNGDYQVNIWCWPIGSGEMYTVRTRKTSSPELREAATPRRRADKPVGEWNHFEIAVKGNVVKVVLNDVVVIPGAAIPDLPASGRIAFQHHGQKNRKGEWTGPPSLVQYRNVSIRELSSGEAAPSAAVVRPIRTLVITGGHDHDAAFYSLFGDNPALAAVPVDTMANAFKKDLRDKYDVVVLYDFTRDADEDCKAHLRAFVESGKGVVVLHHALLDFQTWKWWTEEAVGGRYRLQREGARPSSSVKMGETFSLTPVGSHPILKDVPSFKVKDEAYRNMFLSPNIRPLLTTDNAASDSSVAWIGPTPNYKVVAIQLGHGNSIFSHPTYRTLIRNAIDWAAGRTK